MKYQVETYQTPFSKVQNDDFSKLVFKNLFLKLAIQTFPGMYISFFTEQDWVFWRRRQGSADEIRIQILTKVANERFPRHENMCFRKKTGYNRGKLS